WHSAQSSAKRPRSTMPTYEYRCEHCGSNVEVVQSFTDAPLTACASCGGPLRKVYAPVGIVFKGSGFYKTDSRASSKSRSTAAGSPDGGGTDKADGAKRPDTSDTSGTSDTSDTKAKKEPVGAKADASAS